MYSKKTWKLIHSTYISSTLRIGHTASVVYGQNAKVPRIFSYVPTLHIHSGKILTPYSPAAYGYTVKNILKNNGSKR